MVAGVRPVSGLECLPQIKLNRCRCFRTRVGGYNVFADEVVELDAGS